MSYVLINGKRCYKNDVTGEVTDDNVSQAAADRRATQNTSRPVSSSTVTRREPVRNSGTSSTPTPHTVPDQRRTQHTNQAVQRNTTARAESSGGSRTSNTSRVVSNQRRTQNTNQSVQRNTETRQEQARNSRVISNLISLVNRWVHAATVLLIVASLVLTTAFCIRENVGLRNPFGDVHIRTDVHFQLKSAEGIANRLTQVEEHFQTIFAKEGDK